MAEWFTNLAGDYNNIVSVILMMIGLYIVIISPNMVKKLIGVAIFQTSVLLIYISAAYVSDARFPILLEGTERYVNPLPHVLMLTAIVVGIATLAVGLALVVRIKDAYDTIDEDEILEIEKDITAGHAKDDKKKAGTPSRKKTSLAKDSHKPAMYIGFKEPKSLKASVKKTTKKSTKTASSKKGGTSSKKGGTS